MNNRNLAQYLLLSGVLHTNEVPELLRKSMVAKPTRTLIAMQQGFLTGVQAQSLSTVEDFVAEVKRKKLLSDAQLASLERAIPDDGIKIAQVLLDAGRTTYAQIDGWMAVCEDEDVLRSTVARAAGDSLREEVPIYSEFVTTFCRSVMRFMDTPVLLSPYQPILDDSIRTFTVSQRLSGDMNLVTGFRGNQEVSLEMARRYSHEEIHAMDELAVDSLSEFLNVVNGLFAVNMARQDFDVDLHGPRVEANVTPGGSRQMALELWTGFGTFILIIATDEFAFRENE